LKYERDMGEGNNFNKLDSSLCQPRDPSNAKFPRLSKFKELCIRLSYIYFHYYDEAE
jgi:hypothetical protein